MWWLHMFAVLVGTVGAFLAARYGMQILIAPAAGCPRQVPNWIPFVGSVVEFSKDILGFLRISKKKYGDVFRVTVMGKQMVFVCDPHAIPSIMKMQGELSFESVGDHVMKSVFGLGPESLDFMPKEGVSKQYKQHLLAEKGLEHLTNRAQDALQDIMTELIPSSCATVSLHKFVRDIMFRVTVRALFGPTLDTPEAAKDFQVFDQYFPLLVAGVPASALSSASQARHALDTLFKNGDYQETSSDFIAARDDLFAQSIPRSEAVKYQTTMLWASLSNTMPATFWTLFFLIKHKSAMDAIMEEVQQEVKKCKPNRNGMVTFHQEQLTSMRKLESAIHEALRLSSGSLVVRDVIKDGELSWPGMKPSVPWSLKKGERVCVYPPMVHYDKDVYPNPTEFKWDRFVEGGANTKVVDKEGKRIQHGLMTFGGGVSLCPGRRFAINEIKAFLAQVLSQCSFSFPTNLETPTPTHDMSRVGLGIYSPKTDVMVNISKKYRKEL